MQRLLLALSLTSVFSQEIDGVTSTANTELIDGVTFTANTELFSQELDDVDVTIVTALEVDACASCGIACQDATAWINAGCTANFQELITLPAFTVTADTAAPVTVNILEVDACASCGTACQDATAWINAGCCTGC